MTSVTLIDSTDKFVPEIEISDTDSNFVPSEFNDDVPREDGGTTSW